MPRSAFTGALVAMLMLAGCATTGPEGPAVPRAEAQARQAAREQALRADADWGLEGRIAVSSDGQGGSGRIEWVQAGDRFDVVLSAPITRQGWRLTGRPGFARLEGVEGGPREGPDAAALLWAATRWSIPVESLQSWLRGLPAPGRPAEVGFGRDGRLARLVQDGWTIDYTWPSDPAALLPTRVQATRGGATVRLAIDRWTDGPAQ